MRCAVMRWEGHRRLMLAVAGRRSFGDGDQTHDVLTFCSALAPDLLQGKAPAAGQKSMTSFFTKK